MELGRDGAQHLVRITSRGLAPERTLGASRALIGPPSPHLLGRQCRLRVVQAAEELRGESGTFVEGQPECVVEDLSRVAALVLSLAPPQLRVDPYSFAPTPSAGLRAPCVRFSFSSL